MDILFNEGESSDQLAKVIWTMFTETRRERHHTHKKSFSDVLSEDFLFEYAQFKSWMKTLLIDLIRDVHRKVEIEWDLSCFSYRDK